ncbi:DUF456 domain-containing protein [Haloparvum sp. PAK95]|uniref:DUF456 domain-containing protein n=1 Tax=Haloparvum sp. PAK95 TaxID=3418962 RepID=UPI003D2F4101
MELVLAVALALLVAGVAGSIVPLVPAGVPSLAGIYLYAAFGAEPLSVGTLVAFTVVGVVAAALELLGGPLAARGSGASTRTMLAAAGVGFLLFFVTGPVGIVIGMVLVVFYAEYSRGMTPELAARRAGYTVLGVLVAAAAQLFLTLAMLAGFLWLVYF